MFVPVFLEVPVGTVKGASPLFLVEVDLVGLVDKVGGEQKHADELGELS